jgi:hypothetical protein
MPNDDDPTIMATTTPMAGEDGGTYKTPSKRAIHIITRTTLIPYRSEGTSVRLDYGDGLVDGPVSTQGCLDRRTPTEIPVCWQKRSPSEVRSSGPDSRGGGVTFSSSSSSSSPPKDLGSEGIPSPRTLATTRAAL